MDWLIDHINTLLSYDFITDNLIPFFLDIGKYTLISFVVVVISYWGAYHLTKHILKPLEVVFSIVMITFIILSMIFIFILFVIMVLGIWIFFTVALSYAISDMTGFVNDAILKTISGIICVLLIQLLGYGLSSKLGN